MFLSCHRPRAHRAQCCCTRIFLATHWPWTWRWAPGVVDGKRAQKWDEKKVGYARVYFLSRNTNKMQPCNRIYYFKVY